MEITQLKYLITIVESDYNISSAAKKLYTSQSTISQVVLNIEKESNSPLFVREKGRLRSLTPFGMFIYSEALKIVELYDSMMEKVQEGIGAGSSTLKIGVPELIVKVYLQDFIIDFMAKNPTIRLEIMELGSKDIALMLEKGLLDFAILVEPTTLNPSRFHNQTIIEDTLDAFMSDKHELAGHKEIEWNMLEKMDLALFHSDFITHQLITEKLTQVGITNKRISITSSSWRFLIDMCINNNMVTLLATKVIDTLPKSAIVSKPVVGAIPFKVSIWSQKRDRVVSIEEQFKTELQKFTENYTNKSV